MAVAELKEVSKTYRLGGAEVHALKDVNLRVAKGEFVAIEGPSGSGKSTLLHVTGCLDRPTSGKVLIEGADVSNLRDTERACIRREKIGFVFQFFYLVPMLSALENVELPMVFANAPRSERRARAKELLELVGLGGRLHHRPAELSGGERQRVAIARAMSNDPLLILADEPTGNLDTKTGKEIMRLFVKLNEMGRTIVVVTHDPVISAYADRILHLKDGSIVKERAMR